MTGNDPKRSLKIRRLKSARTIMIETLSSRVEGDCLILVASGKIESDGEYRSYIKQCCDEVLQSGLNKVIVDETNVAYILSFALQANIVDFYSSEELPEEFSTWKVACVGPEDMTLYVAFWADVAQRSGYNHHSFHSIESAREFISN